MIVLIEYGVGRTPGLRGVAVQVVLAVGRQSLDLHLL